MTKEVDKPAAANEDSTALLTSLTSALKAAVGDIAPMRAVTTLAPLDSKLPVWTEAVADGAELASIPTEREPRLLGTSMDNTVGTIGETDTDSRPTSPPNGDSEVNVGVEP